MPGSPNSPIDYYDGAALKEADELQRTAILLYQESETDVTELIQSLKTAREIRQQHIETVLAYNTTIIELELYTGE